MLPKDKSKLNEYIKKQRENSKGNKNRVGKKHSEQTKLKISITNKGKPSSFKGKHHTEETKKILSIKNTKEKIQCKEKGCQGLATVTAKICTKHLNLRNRYRYLARNPEKRNDYYKKNRLKIKEERKKNRIELLLRQREWRRKLKLRVFSHYSKGKPKCNHCGFEDIRALCLDHINDDGAKHRRQIRPKNNNRGGNSIDVYIFVKRNNYPKTFQVLCMNCNRIKEYEKQKKIKNEDITYGK